MRTLYVLVAPPPDALRAQFRARLDAPTVVVVLPTGPSCVLNCAIINRAAECAGVRVAWLCQLVLPARMRAWLRAVAPGWYSFGCCIIECLARLPLGGVAHKRSPGADHTGHAARSL